MTYKPVRPIYSLTIGENAYQLEGSFGLIEAVERAMNESIITIASNAYDMPIYRFVLLLATILKHCGHDIGTSKVAENIEAFGISSIEFTILRLHVCGFLRISICKPADREAASKDLGESIGKLTGLLASHGSNGESFV